MGIVQIISQVIRSIDVHFVEEVSAPLNAMLNLVREIPQSAHWNSLFRRILRISIALCLMRNDHLRIGFGAEGS